MTKYKMADWEEMERFFLFIKKQVHKVKSNEQELEKRKKQMRKRGREIVGAKQRGSKGRSKKDKKVFKKCECR